MADIPSLPVKKDVVRSLLLKGTVFVHLDPRREGVVVPQWLKQQPQLVLQVGLDMAIPIPDLKVDDTGVFGTLSFNRKPFTCSVPWHGVFAVVGDDGKGMVWPESMPAEVAAEVEREARRAGFRAVPTSGDPSAERDAESRRPEAASSAPTLSLAESDDDEATLPEVSSLSEARSSQEERGSQRVSAESQQQRPRGARRRRVQLPPYLKVVK